MNAAEARTYRNFAIVASCVVVCFTLGGVVGYLQWSAALEREAEAGGWGDFPPVFNPVFAILGGFAGVFVAGLYFLLARVIALLCNVVRGTLRAGRAEIG